MISEDFFAILTVPSFGLKDMIVLRVCLSRTLRSFKMIIVSNTFSFLSSKYRLFKWNANQAIVLDLPDPALCSTR